VIYDISLGSSSEYGVISHDHFFEQCPILTSGSDACSLRGFQDNRDFVEFHGERGFIHISTRELTIANASIPGLTIFQSSRLNEISAISRIANSQRAVGWRSGNLQTSTLFIFPAWDRNIVNPPFGWHQIRISEGRFIGLGNFEFGHENNRYSRTLYDADSILPIMEGTSGGGVFEFDNNIPLLVGVTQSSSISYRYPRLRFSPVSSG